MVDKKAASSRKKSSGDKDKVSPESKTARAKGRAKPLPETPATAPEPEESPIARLARAAQQSPLKRTTKGKSKQQPEQPSKSIPVKQLAQEPVPASDEDAHPTGKSVASRQSQKESELQPEAGIEEEHKTEPETAPESEPETAPESEPETAPESKPETASESGPEKAPEPEPDSEPELGAESEPKSESEAESRPEPDLEPRLAAEPEPPLAAEPEPPLAAEPEPQSEAKPEPDPESKGGKKTPPVSASETGYFEPYSADLREETSSRSQAEPASTEPELKAKEDSSQPQGDQQKDTDQTTVSKPAAASSPFSSLLASAKTAKNSPAGSRTNAEPQSQPEAPAKDRTQGTDYAYGVDYAGLAAAPTAQPESRSAQHPEAQPAQRPSKSQEPLSDLLKRVETSAKTFNEPQQTASDKAAGAQPGGWMPVPSMPPLMPEKPKPSSPYLESREHPRQPSLPQAESSPASPQPKKDEDTRRQNEEESAALRPEHSRAPHDSTWPRQSLETPAAAAAGLDSDVEPHQTFEPRPSPLPPSRPTTTEWRAVPELPPAEIHTSQKLPVQDHGQIHAQSTRPTTTEWNPLPGFEGRTEAQIQSTAQQSQAPVPTVTESSLQPEALLESGKNADLAERPKEPTADLTSSQSADSEPVWRFPTLPWQASSTAMQEMPSPDTIAGRQEPGPNDENKGESPDQVRNPSMLTWDKVIASWAQGTPGQPSRLPEADQSTRFKDKLAQVDKEMSAPALAQDAAATPRGLAPQQEGVPAQTSFAARPAVEENERWQPEARSAEPALDDQATAFPGPDSRMMPAGGAETRDFIYDFVDVEVPEPRPELKGKISRLVQELRDSIPVDPQAVAQADQPFAQQEGQKTDYQTDALPGPRADALPGPRDAQPGARADAQPGARADALPAARADAQTSPEIDAFPGAKTEAKPDRHLSRLEEAVMTHASESSSSQAAIRAREGQVPTDHKADSRNIPPERASLAQAEDKISQYKQALRSEGKPKPKPETARKPEPAKKAQKDSWRQFADEPASPADALNTAIEALKSKESRSNLKVPAKPPGNEHFNFAQELAALASDAQTSWTGYAQDQQTGIKRLKSKASSKYRFEMYSAYLILCLVLAFGTEKMLNESQQSLFTDAGKRVQAAVDAMTPDHMFRNFYFNLKSYNPQDPLHRLPASKQPHPATDQWVTSPIGWIVGIPCSYWYAVTQPYTVATAHSLWTQESLPLAQLLIILAYFSALVIGMHSFYRYNRVPGLGGKLLIPLYLAFFGSLAGAVLSFGLQVPGWIGFINYLIPSTAKVFVTVAFFLCTLDLAGRSFLKRNPKMPNS